MGVSENKGYLILGPYNKDPTIEGTILGSPIFGTSQIITFTIWGFLIVTSIMAQKSLF